jgi:hypothetical protein
MVVDPAGLAVLIKAAAHAAAYRKALGFRYVELPRPDNLGGWVENLLGAPRDGFATLDFNARTMQAETDLQTTILKKQAADALKRGPVYFQRFHADLTKIHTDKDIFAEKLKIVQAINRPGDDARREVMKTASEIQVVAGLLSRALLFASGVICPPVGMAAGFIADVMEEKSNHPDESVGAIVVKPFADLARDASIDKAGEMAVKKQRKLEALIERVSDLQKDKAELQDTMRAISAQVAELFPAVRGQPGAIARLEQAAAASAGNPGLSAYVKGLESNIKAASQETAEVSKEFASRAPAALRAEKQLGFVKGAGGFFSLLSAAITAREMNEIWNTYLEQKKDYEPAAH